MTKPLNKSLSTVAIILATACGPAATWSCDDPMLHAGFRGFGTWSNYPPSAQNPQKPDSEKQVSKKQNSEKEVFKLSYQTLLPVEIGRTAQLMINYETVKPVNNARLVLQGNGDIEILSDKHIKLNQNKGIMPIRFRLTDKGESYIAATIKGEEVGYNSIRTRRQEVNIFLRAR